MINDKASFYRQLAQSDELQNNLFSIILCKHPDLDTSSRELFFEKISPFYKRYSLDDRNSLPTKIATEENEINEWQGLVIKTQNQIYR